MTAQELSAYYSIDRRVSALVFGILDEHKKVKRINTREAAMVWAGSNLFAEVTGRLLATEIGVSVPTAVKIIGSRPDVFRKLGRGRWEVRDATADRIADKRIGAEQ